MKKTKVTNKTPVTILLKEGTQGVYRTLKKLDPEDKYVITVDPNATYREYWCVAKDNDPKGIILSSDDCQDNSSIELYFDGGTYNWRPSKDSTRVVRTEAPGPVETPEKGLIVALKEKWNAFLNRVSGDRSTL